MNSAQQYIYYYFSLLSSFGEQEIVWRIEQQQKQNQQNLKAKNKWPSIENKQTFQMNQSIIPVNVSMYKQKNNVLDLIAVELSVALL